MKILMISYAYDTAPFHIFTGSQRAFSFTKYLTRKGVNVHVVSFRDRTTGFEETGTYGEPIYRALDFWGMIGRHAEKHVSPAARPQTIQTITPTYSREWRKRLFYIPDRQWLWALNAFRAASSLHKKEHYDAVLTSSPPESTHIVGWLLKKWCKIPWVADMRDGWMFEPYLNFRRMGGFRQWLECKIEKFLLSRADAITAVTPPIVDDTISRLKVSPARTATIPNGYDLEEWGNLYQNDVDARSPFSAERGKMCIVHLGRLSEARVDRRADHFFKALYEMKKIHPTLADEMSVLLVGVGNGPEVDTIRSLAIDDIVRIHHHVPKPEATRIMRDADVLLLVTSVAQKSIATSKLFDYMAAGRPVLALADGNAAAAIVRETGIGLCVHPMNTGEIKGALWKLLDWRKHNNYPFEPHDDAIKKYNRENLAERMRDIVSTITKS